jgi:hypothetical protein
MIFSENRLPLFRIMLEKGHAAMMAPQFERARMLCTAINTATYELMEPVDRVEVGHSAVIVWAGAKQVTLKVWYANSYDERGQGIPGGGSWQAEVVSGDGADAASRRPFLQRLLSRLGFGDRA